MALSSSPRDPPASSTTTVTASAGTTAPPLFTNPPPRDPRPPTPPPPQNQLHYHYSHLAAAYPLQSQQQSPVYAARPLPSLAARVPADAIHPQSAAKPHDPPQGILYPVASSGRGFLSKGIRSQYADQTVTIANPVGLQPRHAFSHPQSVRPFGFPHSDPHGQAVHLTRPTQLQRNLLGSTGSMMSVMVKGVPVSANPKVSLSQPLLSDCNGCKDPRDRRMDDAFVTVRDRKVRISKSSSVYSLCRSWLRNGFPKETEPQYLDDVRSLPKPSPSPVADTHLPEKRKGEKEEEEEEGPVENLSPNDLLNKHIKRAKRVRAQFREERLRRIARYRSRLALLLPPLAAQQQFQTDSGAGNPQNL